MDVIYWLIPLSIVVLIVAVLILFWAVKNGQFQDLESPAVDILFDDDEELMTKSKDTKPDDKPGAS